MKNIIFILILFVLNIPCAFGIDYNKYDLYDIDSLRNITNDYKNEFKNKQETVDAENSFNEFIKYYEKFVSIQNEKNLLSYNYFNPSKLLKEYTNKYYKYGLIVQIDEGEFFFVSSKRYMYKNFAKYLSKPHRKLLKFETRFDNRIINDCRYIISQSELKKILEFYKKFEKEYPEYSKQNKIDNIIKKYKKDIEHYPYLIYWYVLSTKTFTCFSKK